MGPVRAAGAAAETAEASNQNQPQQWPIAACWLVLQLQVAYAEESQAGQALQLEEHRVIHNKLLTKLQRLQVEEAA